MGEDALGNDRIVTTRDEVRVAGWSEPQSEEEKLAGHDRIVADLHVFAPTGAFINSDAVIIDGIHYEVIDVANFDHNPFGWSPNADVVKVRRITTNAPPQGDLRR